MDTRFLLYLEPSPVVNAHPIELNWNYSISVATHTLHALSFIQFLTITYLHNKGDVNFDPVVKVPVTLLSPSSFRSLIPDRHKAHINATRHWLCTDIVSLFGVQ